MRLVFALVLLGVLAITPAAFADAGIGCGGDDTVQSHPDMTVPADLSTPGDLSSPRDLSPPRDARRDRRRRRRAAGAGLIVLAGLCVGGVSVARKRVRA